MRRLREESGQSLVELLVTLALGVVVLTAVLATFESFNSGARRTDQIVDVEDDARTQLDRLSRDLRGATPVTAGGDAIVLPAAPASPAAVSTNDLVVGRVSDTSTGSAATSLRRYCVGSGTLWQEDLPGTTVSAGLACPSTTTASRVLRGTPLAGMTGTVFSLDAGRTTIGIRLPLTAQTGPGRTSTIPIRTAVRLRTTLGVGPNVAPGQVTQTCTTNGRALLSVAGGSAGNLANTTISVGGSVVGGASATVQAVAGTVATITITGANGLVQTLQKQLVACP